MTDFLNALKHVSLMALIALILGFLEHNLVIFGNSRQSTHQVLFIHVPCDLLFRKHTACVELASILFIEGVLWFVLLDSNQSLFADHLIWTLICNGSHLLVLLSRSAAIIQRQRSLIALSLTLLAQWCSVSQPIASLYRTCVWNAWSRG